MKRVQAWLAHSLLALTIFLAVPLANAASLRCPAPVFDKESARFSNLWAALGESGAATGDGPLGCPYGSAYEIGPGSNESSWTGVVQQFQRGWILLGNGNSTGIDAIFVRGYDVWTIWWTGLPATLAFNAMGGGAPPFVPKPAAWSQGGTVLIAPTATTPLSLWNCTPGLLGTMPNPCPQAFPTLDPIKDVSPFDASARLKPNLLARPSEDDFSVRLAAEFPDWLPCFTLPPSADQYPGEGTLAHVIVLMRRTSPCPLTAETPREIAKEWLSSFRFDPDQLPGTDDKDSPFPCKRKGDLDVPLVQLMHVVHEYRSSLGPEILKNVRHVTRKWGGPPREDPHETPDGGCLAYGIIETENHILLQETARYLINDLLAPENLGSEYDNKANVNWMGRFLQQIARRDYYEFNALPYQRYDLRALLALNDYAPDSSVKTMAQGVLDWTFAKHALAANLDRDNRPYRRRPDPQRYSQQAWMGSARTTSAAQLALLVGPLQHVHADIDIELNADAFTDVDNYPMLGVASEGVGTDFSDLADSKYRLPSALRGWLVRRYNDDGANRSTFVQAIHHNSPIADDPKLFLQANSGVEMVSGNRNWSMVAGGTPVPPGIPPSPPRGAGWAFLTAMVAMGVVALVGAALGALFGGYGGAIFGSGLGAVAGLLVGIFVPHMIAGNTQHAKVWDDQAGTVRETILIPSSGGVDRSQTLRFDWPAKTLEGVPQLNRVCVAAGFMCGFNLRMPARPFPDDELSRCPFPVALPSVLEAMYNNRVDDDPRLLSQLLGCQTEPFDDVSGWHRWHFDHGMLAIGDGDPSGKERTVVTWIEDKPVDKLPPNGVTPPTTRTLQMRWHLPGSKHDWYRVHTYNVDVQPKSGEPPPGAVTFALSGDPDDSNTSDSGAVKFPLDGIPDPNWQILLVGCDPTHFLLFSTGHKCNANLAPAITVNVAPPPKQPFSCMAYAYREGSGVIMDVGSNCSKSPYGFFAYVWKQPCFPGQCPPEASNYGFVVVAPSRGWKAQEFAQQISQSIHQPGVGGVGGKRMEADPSSITVPISPPVTSSGTEWTATGPPSSHMISFRWPVLNGPSILSDSGSTTLYGPLGGAPSNWPTALGEVVAPDVPRAGKGVLTSTGNGCFTLAGFPTPSEPDPVGLVVDLRNAASPTIKEPLTSSLGTACN